MKIKET